MSIAFWGWPLDYDDSVESTRKQGYTSAEVMMAESVASEVCLEGNGCHCELLAYAEKLFDYQQK